MKVLLVGLEFAESFWNFKYSLQFTDKKITYPPLGILTAASMLPKEWEKKFVDLNLKPLEDKYLEWADYVFIGGMDTQRKSAFQVIDRCKKLGVKIVAGGPFFTENYEHFEHVDHLVLGEAEATLPQFLEDLKSGNPKHLYLPAGLPDMEKSPTPMWELVDLKKYHSANIQYSRGCPFNCEFCQITKLFGRKVRTKNKKQIISELDSLYNRGFGGPIFFVDDNFIGNKHKLKTEILPAMIEWMEKKDYPFSFLTQASVNLADDEELMEMMVRAGFDSIFLGIETPDEDCLAEAGKFHNKNRDLVANVKKMQRFGLEAWSGFIIGFDSDKESVFDRMSQFIQESGITIAMVGLLVAFKGTKLYKRLEKEGRLILPDGDDPLMNETYAIDHHNILADYALNFVPKMDRKTLLEGHKKVLRNVYSPKPYYERALTFLKEFNPPRVVLGSINPSNLKTFFKSMFVLGILDEGRVYYWKLFFWTLFKKPRLLYIAIRSLLHGYHFRKVFGI